MCTPLLRVRGVGGLSLQPNIQKGRGLTGPQVLEGGCWERGGEFFQGGVVAIVTQKIN